MRTARCSLSAAAGALLLGFAGACHADEPPAPDAAAEAPDDRPALGLMGTIPLYWGEAGDLGEVLNGGGAQHWARGQLEADYRLAPLDSLDTQSLAEVDRLLLAQPRALSGAENVALDAWVRAGGHLLLFADPLMTGETRYAVGDRRRPQDVALLSPILRHWGLDLSFDDSAGEGVAVRPIGAGRVPLNLPGSFALTAGDAQCVLAGEGVLADCRVGQGRVTVLADAALLDLAQSDPAAPAALRWLVERAFGVARETAGRR